MNYSSNVLVSVILPAYNAASFLSETIESVLSQTFADWNLLIVDDGSTDDTIKIANRYCQQDSRIKLFTQANQGVSVARNNGIQMTQGEFIAFLDADDQWLPEKLAAHIQHLSLRPNLGVSFGRVEFITYEGKLTGQFSNSRLTDLEPKHFLYEYPATTMSNLVVRREVFKQIGGFDQNMNYAEDLDWAFRVMCSKRWQIEGINRVLMQYRNNETGLSSELYRMQEGWNLLINKAREKAPDLVNQHYSLAQAVHLRYLARRSLRLGLSSQVGVDFMTRALQSDWRLTFKEPRRTLLTAGAIYGTHLLTSLNLRRKP